MNFFLSRAGGALLGLLIALFAFITLLVIRKRAAKQKGAPIVFVRAVLPVIAALSVFLIVYTLGNILKFNTGAAGLITVSFPLLVYALGVLAFAVLLFVRPERKINPALPFTAAIAILQFALFVFNLLRNWKNFTGGSHLFLYVQILLLTVSALSALLWLTGALKADRPVLRSRLGAAPEHYAKLGVKKDEVALWEDGTRTEAGKRGTYEWWYFDSHLDDGSSLVIVFYTKPMMSPGSAPDPNVTLRLVTKDGREYSQVFRPKDSDGFSAAKERCDVRIGDCRFSGDLHDYEVYFKDDTIEARVHLTGTALPWRPETGHLYFGEADEDYFAWLPAVPEGKVRAEITLKGKTEHHSGVGYHDHNWGNVNMRKVLHHWYWGRARIGEYSVITSYIWGEKKYGYQEFPIFMIARDNKIAAWDGTHLTFSAKEEFIEKETGKPVHDLLVYDYRDGTQRFRVSYRRKDSILNFPMVNDIRGIVRLLAKLSGFDGAYHRFTGVAVIEKFEGDTITERAENEALWELMYFGKTLCVKTRSVKTQNGKPRREGP
jgi:hypothetical protein